MQREVHGPAGGVANNSAYIKTPEKYVPIGNMRNTRLFGSRTDRPRFGQRPGLELMVPNQLGNGNAVQAFHVIKRSSGQSGLVRADSGEITFTDATSESRFAEPLARPGGVAGTGSPYVGFVMDPNFGIARAFGRVGDTAVPDTDGGYPLESYDSGNAGVADILRIAACTGVAAGDYQERAGNLHQVVMGMQCAWHPNAGVAGDANEHTLIFTSLVVPGHNSKPISGVVFTDGAFTPQGAAYCTITAINAETGTIKWRNVIKDWDSNASTVMPTVDLLAAGTLNRRFAVTMPDTVVYDAPLNLFSNSIVVDTDYTYVTAGFFLYVFNTTSGKYLQRTDAGKWSQEAQHVVIRNGLPREYANLVGPWPATTARKSLLLLFTGTNANGSNDIGGAFTDLLDGQPGEQFVQALAHWRSGLAEYQINLDANGNALDAAGSTVLTRRVFPAVADNTGIPWTGNPATGSEKIKETSAGVVHGTLRFSSILGRNPRGGIAFAMCGGIDPITVTTATTSDVAAQRPVYVGITNRGWGVNSNNPVILAPGTFEAGAGWSRPDSTSSPISTVIALNAVGTLRWEADSRSVLKAYDPLGVLAVDWQNDIPTNNGDGGPEATIMGMAIDAQGNLYVAGKKNAPYTSASGNNCFKIEPTAGRVLWQANLGSMIYQHCVAVDPTDNSPIFCGMRNPKWTGADPDGAGPDPARYAFLWKLSSVDGGITKFLDMGLARTLWAFGADANGWDRWHSAFGVSVDRRGRIAFVTSPGV